MDINDLLQNEQIKGILKKTGISEKQTKDVLNTALSSIKSKYNSDPKQTASLLSDKPNTEKDNALSGLIENDFVKGLIKKVGLPESVAKQAQAAMPSIMKQVTSSLSSKGKNSEEGIGGMMNNVMDMFSGDSKNGKKSGVAGMFSGFLGGLFGKK